MDITNKFLSKNLHNNYRLVVIHFNACVVYWPTTWMGCQNRKCTYVNNRCIQSRNIRIITMTMDGLNEYNCDAHKKVGIELLYNSVKTGSQLVWRPDPLVTRCSRESQHPAEWAPGWAAQENGKETQLWPIEWGSICCSSVRSPTPSHTQTFQIKWEVYFSRRLCHSSLLCRCCDPACIGIYYITYVHFQSNIGPWPWIFSFLFFFFFKGKQNDLIDRISENEVGEKKNLTVYGFSG